MPMGGERVPNRKLVLAGLLRAIIWLRQIWLHSEVGRVKRPFVSVKHGLLALSQFFVLMNQVHRAEVKKKRKSELLECIKKGHVGDGSHFSSLHFFFVALKLMCSFTHRLRDQMSLETKRERSALRISPPTSHRSSCMANGIGLSATPLLINQATMDCHCVIH